MTRPGIEPMSPGPLANTLPTRPMSRLYITNVFPIKVGCRGFIANPTSVFLTNLGFPPSNKRKYMEKIQDKDLTASAQIWQTRRVMTIRKGLMVSFISITLLQRSESVIFKFICAKFKFWVATEKKKNKGEWRKQFEY